ncbi:MAG: hypothetical protein Q8W51_01705 [Candidatus Palauibacterales bacterium]|nr:hypothetical protein [Candidatus Palauibacterales bacterium]MDP2584265.1 hypothetical protein [Candidatus Palauibacterales bacterium]
MDDETAKRSHQPRRRRVERHRYDPRAYALVSESLSVTLARLPEHRQLTARECAEGVLELAARHFGLLGDAVLESWGIHASEDIGRIVSELVEHGAVSLGDDDRIEDFGGLFRVDLDFAARYRIGEGLRSRSAQGKRRRP